MIIPDHMFQPFPEVPFLGGEVFRLTSVFFVCLALTHDTKQMLPFLFLFLQNPQISILLGMALIPSQQAISD